MVKHKQPAAIGIDVSKDTLEVALLFVDESFSEAQFRNNIKGIKQLLAWLAEQGAKCCPICVEATGGLETNLCERASRAKNPIQVAPPAQVAYFRKSLNMRNKTDGDDARLIARFAVSNPNYRWTSSSQAIQTLKDALKRRHKLTLAKTMLRNSEKTLRTAGQKRSAAADLRHLEQRIDQIDASIERLIAENEQLAQTCKLLCSIPGIGMQIAATLCAVLDDNTFEHPKQLAAFIGIALMRRQSGNCEARAHISKIGKRCLRTALFMAALSARLHNPIIRDFANRLQRRRPELSKKEIIVACAHKLARIIHGVLKHNKPFDPRHECPAAA